MILRRLTKHVNDQNWFAVALDFLIVVVGVFVGLQVNNWNSVRQDRMQEQRYLERLNEDITVSIERNEWRVEFMQRQDRYITLALDRLNTCNIMPEDRDAIANAFYHVGKSLPPVLMRGVIDELNATGKFQIIRNVQLRDAVTAITEANESSQLVFETTLMRATPHVVYVESQLEYKTSGAKSGSIDITWNDIEFDQEALCADQRFRKALSAARYYTNDMTSAVTLALDTQRSLLAMIALELKS